MSGKGSFSFADINTVWMLVFTVYDVLYCSINVIESRLTLLLCVIDECLVLLDGLLLVALHSQFVMTNSHFLDALLSRVTTEQLQRCLSAWTIRGKNPYRPLPGQIIGYYGVFEFIARDNDQQQHTRLEESIIRRISASRCTCYC